MPATPTPSPLAIAMVLGLMAAIFLAWAWAIVKRLGLGEPLLPRAPRRLVPWGGASVLGVLALYLGLQVAVGLGYAVWMRLSGAPRGAVPASAVMLVSAIAGLALIQLAPPFLWLTSRARWEDLGLTGRQFGRNVARGAWFCALLLPVVYAVSLATMAIWPRQAHPVEEMLGGGAPRTMALAVFMAVIVAPISEELVFRAVLLGWFWKRGARRPPEPPKPLDPEFGPELAGMDPFVAAIVAEPEPEPAVAVVEEPAVDPFAGRGGRDLIANVVASLIFAGLHFAQWPSPIPLFVLSLGLGEIYRRTGSLVAPIALHATFNGISTAFMIATAAGR